MAKALIAAIAALVIVAVAAAAVARDDSPTAAAAPGGAVVMAAGDIATPGGARDLTAALLGPAGAVLTLGDNAYPDGTFEQFQRLYAPTWGVFRAKTYPAPGNHDYHTPNASGYKAYFGQRATPAGETWYSFDLGGWHLISLDSNCSEVGCGPGSPQYAWLEQDLSSNTAQCVLAYWHHPRFSSGEHGSSRASQPFWNLLYQHGGDVVLNGHDHTYERFAALTPDGRPDPGGIREFVVGTGGAGLYPFGAPEPGSEVRQNSTHGVLQLSLRTTGYDWRFVPVAGGTFSDTGSDDCS
jgi:3',5'-cyclic AMP phosphodiesterase CpdA